MKFSTTFATLAMLAAALLVADLPTVAQANKCKFPVSASDDMPSTSRMVCDCDCSEFDDMSEECQAECEHKCFPSDSSSIACTGPDCDTAGAEMRETEEGL